MSNPVFAFATSINAFQGQFAGLIKKNQELEDSVKEKDQQIAQLKAALEAAEAGNAGAKANRPILLNRTKKHIVDFNMDETTGHAEGQE